MWIVNITQNPNGSHNNHKANHITEVPAGWAMIPDDFAVPATFPFVDLIAEEVTHYFDIEVEKEVPKTREVPKFDEEGNLLPETETETYTEIESVVERIPRTMMTVISMAEGVVPEEPDTEPEPTQLDMIEAQVTYTAMMTDTLLEV